MIAFALVAAVGIFLVVEAVGTRPVRVRLTEMDKRPFGQRIVDTLFAPAAERVVTATSRMDLKTHKIGLARRLARAGYPPPFVSPEAVLGYRLFTAIIFAVMGAVFALLTGLGVVAVPLALCLAAFGWVLPDRTIANAKRERREQLMLDAASTLDRLAIYVAAGNALPSAVRSLAEKPGGAWVAEFRQMAAAYAVGGEFDVALEEVIEKSGRLPDIARVCEHLRAAYEMGGGGLAESLRKMAHDARIRIRLLITERGHKNAVLMVIPAFFSILALMIVLIAPGVVRMFALLAY